MRDDPWHRVPCSICDRRAFTVGPHGPVCLWHLFERAPRWHVRAATMRGSRHA